jgi:predicted PurR-regulated permease PerM
MTKTAKLVFAFVAGLVVIFMVWRFSHIVFYILTSAVLSLIGRPVVKKLNSLHFWKFKIPNGISAFITLLLIMLVFTSFFGLLVPLLAAQADIIANINLDALTKTLHEPLLEIELFLKKYNLLTHEETLNQLINKQIAEVFSFASFSHTLSSIISMTGSIFLAFFSIMFFTYFFLKDAYLLNEMIDMLTPDKYETQVQHILGQTKKLLSRYFIGLVIEIFIMMTLFTIGLTLFGIQNALLIGFLGGLMNIIPYLGPLIGAVIGILLAASTSLSSGYYSDVFPLALMVAVVFLTAKLIDDLVLQPLIYSNSVNAHPVEIFLVILMGASIAGIPGMILAVPSYTVLRIVAKEFLSQLKIVQKLTRNI